MITVVHKRTHTRTPYDFYIGRGSPLGNPFTHRKQDLKENKGKALYWVETREEAIAKYEKWLIHALSNKWTKEYKAFYELVRAANKHDIYLVCYCSPEPCHGDVIKAEIERILFPNETLLS